MPSIFDGLDGIIDAFLPVDETWKGQAPRYGHKATLQRLCNESGPIVDGTGMLRSLYDRILTNWDAASGINGPPSEENWRFEKRTNFSQENRSSETLLERTISKVVDDENWANQVPVDSGLIGGRAHVIDLVFRAGMAFSFIELKDESNTPLSAAIQVVRYGLVYAFTRSHAAELGVDLNRSPILRATTINLRVLAPAAFYSNYGTDLCWLSRFQEAIHRGVEEFSRENGERLPPMSFSFEVFPEDFSWTNQTAQTAQQPSTQRDVLWAVHRRKPLFPTMG